MSNDVLAILGDPEDVAKDLSAYTRDAAWFSSEHERLIGKYEQQWVAVYRANVRATSHDLMRLLRDLDERDIPREHAIIRFIDRNERTMIL